MKHRGVLLGTTFVLAGLLSSTLTTGYAAKPPAPAAATAAWQPIAGPLGGSVAAVAVSPGCATDGLVFTADFDHLFRSTDRGDTWTPVFNGAVSALVLSPHFDADRTAYGGQHWETANRFPAGRRLTAPKWRPDAGTDAGLWAYRETPFGDVFTVAQGASLPAVASLPGSDRFLAVWDMGLTTVDGTHLRARFVSNTGQPIGPEFAPTSPGGQQHIPSVTANPTAGEFLVSWWDFREPPGAIYGQRLAADGRLIGDDFLIARAANFENWPPAVAYNPVSGEYLAVWYEDRGEAGGSNIYGQRVSAGGAPIGSVFTINDEGTPQVRPAAAASSATGEYLAVWSLIGPELSRNLYGQRLTGSGERIGGAIHLGQGDKPAVTYNSLTEEYLVVWADGSAQAARVRPDGSVVGGIALSEPGSSKEFSDVASDAAGGYVAVWDGPGGDDLSIIFGRELSPEGAWQSPQWPLGSPPGQQMYPAIAYNAQGHVYLAAWEDRSEGEPTVRGRIYRPGQAPPPPGPPAELVNGRFEDGFYELMGRSIANGWAAYVAQGQPSFAGEQFTVHGGQWAYKLSGYAPFTAGLAQVVSVQPGATYRVTAYYQLYPPGDGQAFLGVRDGASATRWVGDSWPGVWRPLSQVLTPASDRLLITLQGSNGADPNTNVYFDDVTVVPIGSP